MKKIKCSVCHASLNSRNHPKFTYGIHDGAPQQKKIMVIIDEGHENRMTVTNGVRCALAIIAEYFFLNLDHVDIIYRDSRGVFDRIITNRSRFLRFETLTSGPEITSMGDAIDKLKEIQKNTQTLLPPRLL